MTHKERAIEIVDELGSPYPNEHSLSVEKILDETYNQAIDDAVSIASEYREMKSKYPDDSSEYNFTNLIAKLESLKKKP